LIATPPNSLGEVRGSSIRGGSFRLSSILKVKAHQREAGAFMNECGKPINLFVTYRGQGTSPANSISQRKERALFQY